jgi:adenosylhomocysteinase
VGVVKNMAIFRIIGHNNTEIQVDMVEMSSGNRIILLSQGRLPNLGNAT